MFTWGCLKFTPNFGDLWDSTFGWSPSEQSQTFSWFYFLRFDLKPHSKWCPSCPFHLREWNRKGCFYWSIMWSYRSRFSKGDHVLPGASASCFELWLSGLVCRGNAVTLTKSLKGSIIINLCFRLWYWIGLMREKRVQSALQQSTGPSYVQTVMKAMQGWSSRPRSQV